MPHLRFRGVKKEEVKEISKNLVDILAEKVECPRDYFTLEYLETTFFFDNQEGANGYPFVEILWFDRGYEVRKEVAKITTDMLKQYNYNCVTVIFTDLGKDRYFENGEHF